MKDLKMILIGILVLALVMLISFMGSMRFGLFRTNWETCKRIENLKVVKEMDFKNHHYLILSNGEVLHDPDCK